MTSIATDPRGAQTNKNRVVIVAAKLLAQVRHEMNSEYVFLGARACSNWACGVVCRYTLLAGGCGLFAPKSSDQRRCLVVYAKFTYVTTYTRPVSEKGLIAGTIGFDQRLGDVK